MTRTRSRMPLLVGLLLAIATAVAPARNARAAGFLLYEQSAEGIGRAAAVAASSTEPAAIWYNPAALSFMPGYQASVYGVMYLGQATFSPRDGSASIDASPTRQPVPAFFATGRVSDRVALGLGVYLPFGLGIEWPSDWVGRQNGLKASIMTMNINPVVSVKLLPILSLAAGVDVMRSAVDITQGLPDAIGGGSVRIGGTAWGVGGNVGLLLRLLPEKLHFSAGYRSRVKLDFSGRAHFEVNEPIFTSTLHDQPGTAKITLPDLIQFGVMVRPNRRLTLELDANVVLWSTYKTIPIGFSDPATPDSAIHPNYHDMVSLRLGVDWRTPLPGLHLRGGFIFEQNPAPQTGLSPTLPDANAVDVSVGVGYVTRWLRADLGYMLVNFLPSKARHSTDPAIPAQSPEGSYRTIAHLLGVTLTVRLGQSRQEAPEPAPPPPPEARTTASLAP
jgi:long-chain fatty acid transport protein